MNPGRFCVLWLLRVYRAVLSPIKNGLMGVNASCRFFPTCSTYAIEAVERYGVVCGGILAAKRICRCHPWGGSGVDLVPVQDRTVS